MPRTGKGSAQPPRAASDQAYGEKGAALEAQKEIPLPNNQIQPQAMGPGPAPAPQRSFDEALLAAQAEGARAMPTPLGAGSLRPDEAVMTPDNKIRNTSQAQVQALQEIQMVTGSAAFGGMVDRMMMTQRANGPTPGPSRFAPPVRTPSPHESRRSPRR